MILSKIQYLLFFAGLVAATTFDNIAKPLARNVNLKKMAMQAAHAFSKGELQATAGLKAASSSDHYVLSQYGSEGCSDDSLFYAASFDTGYCINFESDGQKYSYKPVCNDDGFVYELYTSSGCKSKNIFLSLEVLPVSEECVLDDDLFDDDDDDDFDDDDDLFGGMTYYTAMCTNSIDSSLTDAPGVAYYYGSDCDKQRIGVDYYPETECTAAGTGSVSVTCGDGELDLIGYAGSNTCSTEPLDNQISTGKCMASDSDDDDFDDDDDDDDDDGDDDDDDDFDDDDDLELVNSMYAACKSSDLPDAAFHAFTSVWTAIITSVAVGMALVKHA